MICPVRFWAAILFGSSIAALGTVILILFLNVGIFYPSSVGLICLGAFTIVAALDERENQRECTDWFAMAEGQTLGVERDIDVKRAGRRLSLRSFLMGRRGHHQEEFDDNSSDEESPFIINEKSQLVADA
jgi:hypothetical protein